jgi:cytochrome c biogenesis protein CcdA/thiol-disulfide isomerase/thioredoxin
MSFMILFLISFVAGFLTVLAPCVLPLLPVIVGGGMTDGKVHVKKALTIVLSLAVSVIVFTLLLKVSTVFVHIPEYTWKIISGGIILSIGIITLFPRLWENKFLATLSIKSNKLLGKGDQKKSFWGDVLAGAALGPVFSTCSPTYFIIIATVLPVHLGLGIVYLLAYAIGLSLSLLIVTFAGQKILARFGAASDPKGIFKKVLGIIFIIVGIGILSGGDKTLESKITSAGFFDITKVEQKLLQKNTMQVLPAGDMPNAQDTAAANMQIAAAVQKGSVMPLLTIAQKDAMYKKAPELVHPDGYINTDGKPITLASLKGKVVLLDIWTYSCINCQRTLPYVNDWYAKYKDQGLVVVGLHTPEFGFEKVQSNVEKAVERFGIKYPVVLDNSYQTWNALGNQYWPRKYLIDMDGYIVYDHIGEGGYADTEKEIQKALQERAARTDGKVIDTKIDTPKDMISVDTSKVQSPETYFGAARNQYLANGTAGTLGEQKLSIPKNIDSNSLYLGGTWSFDSEYAETKSASTIVFPYSAKNVYMVASDAAGADIDVYVDDVLLKKVHIQGEQLYTLVPGATYGAHTLRLEVPKGLKAFTFTFG